MSSDKRLKDLKVYIIFFLAAVFILVGIIWLSRRLADFKKETQRLGYHALKINGEYVDTKIFTEENNKFFIKWHRNAAMLRKSDEEIADMVLDEVINRVVLENYLESNSKNPITDKEINEYIDRYIKPKYPSAAERKEFYGYLGYNSESELMREIKLYLYRMQCIPAVAKEYGITVTDAEVDKEYAKQKDESIRVNARHIIISRLEQARDIYNQLKAGANFHDLAVKYSEDTDSKNAGGDLGSLTKDQMPPEYTDKLLNANEGDLIPPFKTKSGYAILNVEKVISYYHPKEEIADILLMQKFLESDQLPKWLEKLRSEAQIEIVSPAYKAFRLVKEGKDGEAAPLYEKLYHEKKLEHYLMRAADCYKKAGNWEKFVKVNKIGMQRYPQKVLYMVDVAEGLYRTGKKKEALDMLKKVEPYTINNAYYRDLIGSKYEVLGYYEDAARIRSQETVIPSIAPEDINK